MLVLNAYTNYYVYSQVVDMRKGCFGLCGIVQAQMKRSLLNGDVFVFFNKRRTTVKLLQWGKDGFCIFEKRLEQGTFEHALHTQHDSVDVLLSSMQLQHILDGISLSSVKRRKRFVA